MEKIAALVFLIALICLIIGLIKPALFKALFKAKTSRKAVALTFGLVMIASVIVVGVVARPVSAADAAQEEIDQAMEEFIKEEEAKQKEAKQVKEEKPTSLTPEEAIKAIIQKELKGENNNDKPFLRDINVAMENNKAFVIINYNANENLTAHLTQVGIKSKMSDLYYKLYKSGQPIGAVSVCAYMTLTDKYGNKTDDIVYTTRLENEEAAKVNWSEDDSMVKNVILPKVWSTLFLHPALSED
ncbi:hypothetical protein FAM09_22245 [Niastella caeni]|uniref:Uncharacterized protein n=1 Tax=Niastella caeni TaxID=2569763 RepID=A0A4S8HLK9_9BACT|nr:hypothetical protein [Niastella caeni]THU36107.1 hypothetical protein FAM09_22245 [Niastella caeni]